VGTEQQSVPYPAIVRIRLSVSAPIATVRVVVSAINAKGGSSNDGDGHASETIPESDRALRHELINVLGSLCLMGLTSILLHDSNRHPPRRTSLPRRATPP
jgi:hypothetical protein